MRPFRNILIKLLLALLLVSAGASAQDLLLSGTHYGFNVSLNLAFGSHFRRAGVNLNFFYVNGALQANSEVRAYFSFRNLGPRFIYPELVLAQGLVYGYGKARGFYNPFVNSISNQTAYSSSIAYSYNAYFNRRHTTQQTGLVAFGFGSVSIIAENDILARTYYDRFRTGAFLLQYQYRDQFQAGLNCTLWMGEMGRRITGEGGCAWPCYMDTVRGVYANYSYGLLSAQLKYNVGYSQNVQANVGVDAEQIRNAVQNRLIHDLVFIPRKWIKPINCHIPMMDDKGGQYTCEPGQKIRSPKLYWNAFSNASVFY